MNNHQYDPLVSGDAPKMFGPFLTAGTFPGTFLRTSGTFAMTVNWCQPSDGQPPQNSPHFVLSHAKIHLWPDCLLFHPCFVHLIWGSWEHTEGTSWFSSCGSLVTRSLVHVLYLQQAGPLSLQAPERLCRSLTVSWFSNTWNLSSSSTGTQQVSVNSSSLRLTCISACVYLLSHGEHLGLNAVQLVEFVDDDENVHFVVIFLFNSSLGSDFY